MPTHSRPVRTLIADDSKAFSKVLEHWIDGRAELERVATVANGRDAVAAVQRLAPDLILIDAVLPELDGFRVVRELRRLRHPPLAVIMTFEKVESARRAAFDAGASGFVTKDEFAEEMELLLPELLRRVASRAEERHAAGRAGHPEP